ncbi:8905_t:CDS:2, partial [Rhizophagus irregularis]
IRNTQIESFDMDLEKLQVGKKHFELRYRSCWKEIPWTSI